MTRGVTTLEEMVKNLRMHTRRSPDPNFGQGEEESLKRLLRDVQYFLYWDFDWPFLNVRRDITMQDGQRYYDVPNDIIFENIRNIRGDGYNRWTEVSRGITMEHYNIYDSDEGEESSPVRRWDIIDAGNGKEQIEVWPMPDEDGETIRIDAVKGLDPLTSDNDTATLDDRLIVFFAAAELLIGQDNNLAERKLQQANALYRRMRGGSQRREGGNAFVMGAGSRLSDRDTSKPPMILSVKDKT